MWMTQHILGRMGCAEASGGLLGWQRCGCFWWEQEGGYGKVLFPVVDSEHGFLLASWMEMNL